MRTRTALLTALLTASVGLVAPAVSAQSQSLRTVQLEMYLDLQSRSADLTARRSSTSVAGSTR